MKLLELKLKDLKNLKQKVMNEFEQYKRKYADDNDLDYDFEVTEDIFYEIVENFESRAIPKFMEKYQLECLFDMKYKSNGNYSLYLQGHDDDPESYVTL